VLAPLSDQIRGYFFSSSLSSKICLCWLIAKCASGRVSADSRINSSKNASILLPIEVISPGADDVGHISSCLMLVDKDPIFNSSHLSE